MKRTRAKKQHLEFPVASGSYETSPDVRTLRKSPWHNSPCLLVPDLEYTPRMGNNIVDLVESPLIAEGRRVGIVKIKFCNVENQLPTMSLPIQEIGQLFERHNVELSGIVKQHLTPVKTDCEVWLPQSLVSLFVFYYIDQLFNLFTDHEPGFLQHQHQRLEPEKGRSPDS